MSATQESLPVTNLMATSVDAFVDDWHVRVTWIAFMTLWVIWSLIWVVRSYFVGDLAPSTGPEATATDAEASTKKFAISVPSGAIAVRLERGYQVVKDTLFCLLCLLSMNTFARGSTYAVMILAWFFTAFATVWFVVELVIDNRFVRVVYTTIFFALGLAIGGLAYKQGFY